MYGFSICLYKLLPTVHEVYCCVSSAMYTAVAAREGAKRTTLLAYHTTPAKKKMLESACVSTYLGLM